MEVAVITRQDLGGTPLQNEVEVGIATKTGPAGESGDVESEKEAGSGTKTETEVRRQGSADFLLRGNDEKNTSLRGEPPPLKIRGQEGSVGLVSMEVEVTLGEGAGMQQRQHRQLQQLRL